MNENILNNIHIPRWNELPNVDLYLDQVVNLINSTLFQYFVKDDKNKKSIPVLTKTMINNYVKNNIIEAPINKLYSKNQFAKLFVICILKQVYSMQEIKKMIDFALKCSNISDKYDQFCTLFEEAVISIYKKESFINSKIEEYYLLKVVLLSCAYKLYVQNVIDK